MYSRSVFIFFVCSHVVQSPEVQYYRCIWLWFSCPYCELSTFVSHVVLALDWSCTCAINRDVHTYTWFTDFKSLYANRLNGNFPTRPLKFIRFFNLSGKYSIYHQKWNSSYLSRHYFSTTVYSKKFNTHKTSHTYLTQARKSISPTTRAYRVVC